MRRSGQARILKGNFLSCTGWEVAYFFEEK